MVRNSKCLLDVVAWIALASIGRSQSQQEIVITNVNVIPMDEERVLENQTVVLREEIVEWVAPTDQSPRPTESHHRNK